MSQALEGAGYTVFHEQAREIIQRSLQSGSNILPWEDLMGFTKEVWTLRMQQYEQALLGSINFYDRTVMDSYAYLIKDKVPAYKQWEQDMDEKRFDLVFLLPVWPEIHAQDTERMETLEDCYEVEKFMRMAYEQKGYTLIDVPFGTIEERLAFIERYL